MDLRGYDAGMKTVCLGILLFVVVSVFVPALLPSFASAQQPAQEPLLDRMVGSWILHGTIEGRETTHDVTAEWILRREYVQLHEVSREKNAKGQPQYEAFVLVQWNSKSNDYACQWLDSTEGGGLSVPAAPGKRDGDKIAFLFKGRDGSLFHTTFVYNSAADTWQWNMDGEEQGKLKPFARLELKRK